MSSVERTYYVFDEHGNKKEALTKNEILDAISSAFQDKTPFGINSVADKLKEINRSNDINFWFGKNNELPAEKSENTLYFVSEHNEVSDIENIITNLQPRIAAQNQRQQSTITALQNRKSSTDSLYLETNEAFSDSETYRQNAGNSKSEITTIKNDFENFKQNLTTINNTFNTRAGKMQISRNLWNGVICPREDNANLREKINVWRQFILYFEFYGEPFVEEFFPNYPVLCDSYNQPLTNANFRTSYDHREFNTIKARGLEIYNSQGNSIKINIYCNTRDEGDFINIADFGSTTGDTNLELNRINGVGEW